MTHNELVALIFLGLMGAMLMGWILRWIYGALIVDRRAMRAAKAAPGPDTQALTERLQEAEAAEARMADYARERERTHATELRQKDAEIDAAMEGLRHARAEAADWQAAYEALAGEKPEVK